MDKIPGVTSLSLRSHSAPVLHARSIGISLVAVARDLRGFLSCRSAGLDDYKIEKDNGNSGAVVVAGSRAAQTSGKDEVLQSCEEQGNRCCSPGQEGLNSQDLQTRRGKRLQLRRGTAYRPHSEARDGYILLSVCAIVEVDCGNVSQLRWMQRERGNSARSFLLQLPRQFAEERRVWWVRICNLVTECTASGIAGSALYWNSSCHISWSKPRVEEGTRVGPGCRSAGREVPREGATE